MTGRDDVNEELVAARPGIPTLQDMESDIVKAGKDDPVFALFSTLMSNSQKNELLKTHHKSAG